MRTCWRMRTTLFLAIVSCQSFCMSYCPAAVAFTCSGGISNLVRFMSPGSAIVDRNFRTQNLRSRHESKLVMSSSILTSLVRVKNIRDLASVKGSPIKPGRCVRSACIGAATKEDEGVILENIKTLVDLRSEKEFSLDSTKYNSTVFEEYNSLFYEVKYSKSGRPKALIPKIDGGESERSRHMLSVIDEGIYKRGVFKKLSLGKKLKAALYLTMSQTKARKLFIDFINAAGLPLLNELILDYGGPSIKAVLDVLSDRANHPVAFYCTAGKDRTGLIAMLVLSTLGVDDEAIFNDYILSDSVYKELDDRSAAVGALQQEQAMHFYGNLTDKWAVGFVQLDPERFLGAPRQVMEETMRLVRREYGGVDAYLDKIGFDAACRARLRRALCDD